MLISLEEFFIIAIVAILILKKGDIKLAISIIKNISTKILEVKDIFIEDNRSEISRKLEKIIKIQGYYKGGYNKEEIQNSYDKIFEIEKSKCLKKEN